MRGIRVEDGPGRQEDHVLDAGGLGRRHEAVDSLRLGVEEHALRTVENGRQGFRALQIGRDDFRSRREARRERLPARQPNLLTRRTQTRRDIATDIAAGAEDHCDHAGRLDR
ncbi:hypothetical protein GCM10027200_49920 [Lentzea nigeriaca]